MTRQQKIAALLAENADDERRLALDIADGSARKSNTFGSKEHRTARDDVEKAHDNARRGYEALSDHQLDQALVRPER